MFRQRSTGILVACEGFVFAVELIRLLFAYSFYSCDTIMSSLVLYSDTGKSSQKIAEILRNKTAFSCWTRLFLVVERNFDHELGNHSWTENGRFFLAVHTLRLPAYKDL